MELLLGILIGVGLPWAIKTVKAARSQGATFIIKGYQVRIEKLEASSNKKPVAEVVPMKKKTPPQEVKDRSDAWQRSAEKYGRPWKEVRDAIQEKRSHYQELDKAWNDSRKEEAILQKALEAEKLRKEKEALKKAVNT